MAYVFLPPRTDNFFPAGPPYLSGLRGLRGLGDYAADLATYKHAMALYETAYKVWSNKKKKYDAALIAYCDQVKSIDDAWASTLDAYKKKYDVYLLLYAAYGAQVASIKKANTTKSQTINSSYGLNLPKSYFDNGACLTQAQHDSYSCHTVKGLLGIGLGGADPGCGYRLLPICAYPTAPTPPAYPTKPAYPAKPKSPGSPPTAPKAPAAPPPTPVVVPVATPVPVSRVSRSRVIITPVVVPPWTGRPVSGRFSRNATNASP